MAAARSRAHLLRWAATLLCCGAGYSASSGSRFNGGACPVRRRVISARPYWTSTVLPPLASSLPSGAGKGQSGTGSGKSPTKGARRASSAAKAAPTQAHQTSSKAQVHPQPPFEHAERPPPAAADVLEMFASQAHELQHGVKASPPKEAEGQAQFEVHSGETQGGQTADARGGPSWGPFRRAANTSQEQQQQSQHVDEGMFGEVKEYIRGLLGATSQQHHPPSHGHTGEPPVEVHLHPATVEPTERQMNRVLGGVAATAIALPGLLFGRTSAVAGLVVRSLRYRFPVVAGAYVAAAMGTRWMMGRLRTIWRRRPVRDLNLDASDRRSYGTYGGVYHREALHVLELLLPPERNATEPVDELTGKMVEALLRPCEPMRRDEYVMTVAACVRDVTAAAKEDMAALFTNKRKDAVAMNLPGLDLGRVLLCMRLADATARVARDATAGSALRVQAAQSYWEGRFNPHGRFWRYRPWRTTGKSEGGRKSDRQRLVQLDALLAEHLDAMGLLQAHLLRRPVLKKPVGEVLAWAEKAMELAENAVLIGGPEREAAGHRADVWHMLKGLIGRDSSVWGFMTGSEEETDSAPMEEKVEDRPPPPQVVHQEDGPAVHDTVVVDGRLAWQVMWLRGNSTVEKAQRMREEMKRYMEARNLDRPRLNPWALLTARGAGYIFFFRVLNVFWNQRDKITDNAAATRRNLEEFLSYRFLEPGRAILDDLILNRRSRLTDASAIDDAKDTLRRMLADFIDDMYPKMNKGAKDAAIAAMDISVVSDQYGKEVRSAVRNVLSGRIVRMLLIQVQFIKKELLVAMEAIDELYNANRVNLQALAVIPAIFTTYMIYRMMVYVIGVAASRRIQSTAGLHAALRRVLRDMERMLILAPRPGVPQGVAVSAGRVQPSSNGGVGRWGAPMLEGRSMGAMVLLSAEFQTVLRINAARLDAATRRALEEDLSDLFAGPQTTDQQLASLHRIRRSYGFLQVRSSGALLELLP